MARRVLPTPPGPISVTKRLEPTASPSCSSSTSRPTKLLSCSRRLPATVGTDCSREWARGSTTRERRVLIKDPGLEVAQGRARIDAELLDEVVADLGVGAQCFGLASCSVEGEHEQLPETLAERVFPAQRLELVDQLRVAAAGQIRFDPGFDGDDGQLLEMCSFRTGEIRVGEFGKRFAASKRKGVGRAQSTRGPSRPSRSSAVLRRPAVRIGPRRDHPGLMARA